MNIFLRELKANARSLFFWCLFIVFFIYMGISKFQPLPLQVPISWP